jgi:flagella synthesis protein FlgN
MQAWIDSGSANDRDFASAKKRWAELISLTQSAKELNRVNGLLIGSHMARNQSALNALQSGQNGGNVYGPNGQPSRNMPSRSLIVS